MYCSAWPERDRIPYSCKYPSLNIVTLVYSTLIPNFIPLPVLTIWPNPQTNLLSNNLPAHDPGQERPSNETGMSIADCQLNSVQHKPFDAWVLGVRWV